MAGGGSGGGSNGWLAASAAVVAAVEAAVLAYWALAVVGDVGARLNSNAKRWRSTGRRPVKPSPHVTAHVSPADAERASRCTISPHSPTTTRNLLLPAEYWTAITGRLLHTACYWSPSTGRLLGASPTNPGYDGSPTAGHLQLLHACDYWPPNTTSCLPPAMGQLLLAAYYWPLTTGR